MTLPLALRSALVAADFTYQSVAQVLGAQAHAALSRNETTPGLRATAGGTPVETLTRLFLLQVPVPLARAEQALPGLVEAMAVAGLVEQSVGEVAARLDVRPYASDDPEVPDLWVLSDLTPGLDGRPPRVRADHVLGVSSASTSLAQLTLREPVGRALDLGTGCGVQALHLARHCDTVVATDVNPRALWMTRFNTELNGLDGQRDGQGQIEVREGSFFEPVAAERFDLIATNPPFVISPATGERLVYRDSGLPGDRVVEEIVRRGPDLLTDGGWCQVLGNWVIADGVEWRERLAGWVPDDCSALVVQREVVDPASYVELWLKDAGVHGTPEYRERYDTWLSWFADQGIEAVGFGWFNLRKGGTAREFLDWPYEVEQPIAPAIAAWGRAHPATPPSAGALEILERERLMLRPDVLQETRGAPGAPDPEAIVLRQQLGFRRARQVDTVEAAVVGACDGDLRVGQLLDAVAQLLGRDAAELRSQYLPVLAELLGEGYLERA